MHVFITLTHSSLSKFHVLQIDNFSLSNSLVLVQSIFPFNILQVTMTKQVTWFNQWRPPALAHKHTHTTHVRDCIQLLLAACHCPRLTLSIVYPRKWLLTKSRELPNFGFYLYEITCNKIVFTIPTDFTLPNIFSFCNTVRGKNCLVDEWRYFFLSSLAGL